VNKYKSVQSNLQVLIGSMHAPPPPRPLPRLPPFSPCASSRILRGCQRGSCRDQLLCSPSREIKLDVNQPSGNTPTIFWYKLFRSDCSLIFGASVGSNPLGPRQLIVPSSPRPTYCASFANAAISLYKHTCCHTFSLIESFHRYRFCGIGMSYLIPLTSGLLQIQRTHRSRR
jgi:hypothetical protein